MFFKGSRYEKVGEYSPTDITGKSIKVKRLRPTPVTSGRFLHTVKQGDRLDLMAAKYYRDPKRFWLICDANNKLYPNDLLEPGRKIIIPPDIR